MEMSEGEKHRTGSGPLLPASPSPAPRASVLAFGVKDSSRAHPLWNAQQGTQLVASTAPSRQLQHGMTRILATGRLRTVTSVVCHKALRIYFVCNLGPNALHFPITGALR